MAAAVNLVIMSIGSLSFADGGLAPPFHSRPFASCGIAGIDYALRNRRPFRTHDELSAAGCDPGKAEAAGWAIGFDRKPRGIGALVSSPNRQKPSPRGSWRSPTVPTNPTTHSNGYPITSFER